MWLFIFNCKGIQIWHSNTTACFRKAYPWVLGLKLKLQKPWNYKHYTEAATCGITRSSVYSPNLSTEKAQELKPDYWWKEVFGSGCNPVSYSASLLNAQMWMNVMGTIGASMAVRTSWVDTDVAAHKDLSSTTSGISVLVRKQTAQNAFKQEMCHNVYRDSTRQGQEWETKQKSFLWVPLHPYAYFSQHKSMTGGNKKTHSAFCNSLGQLAFLERCKCWHVSSVRNPYHWMFIEFQKVPM